MVQFLSIIFFFLGFLQFLLGFSKVSIFLCHPVLLLHSMKPQHTKHTKVKTALYRTRKLTMSTHRRYGNINHICNAFYLPLSLIFCTKIVNMNAMMIYQPVECFVSNHMKFIRVRLYGVTNTTNIRKMAL